MIEYASKRQQPSEAAAFIELSQRSGYALPEVVEFAMRGQLATVIDRIEQRKAQAARPHHSTAFDRRVELAKRSQVINTPPARRYDGERHLHVPAGS
jgi:hypothetical protein